MEAQIVGEAEAVKKQRRASYEELEEQGSARKYLKNNFFPKLATWQGISLLFRAIF